MEEVKQLNSLKEIVDERFEEFKDNIAFIEKDCDHKEFETIKYKQIKEKINGLGTYMLDELNLKDKKIAVIGENSSRWYITYMAVVCGVGVIVPIDKGLPENEILNLLKKCNASAIVYSSRRKDTILSLKDRLPKDMVYIDMNKRESDTESLSFDRILEKGIDLVDNGSTSYTNAQIDPNLFSVLLFTSGTSEKPKGVMLSHKNLCANIYSCSCIAPDFKNYTSMSIIPMHHPYEFTLDYLYMTSIGATIGICQGLKFFAKDIKIIKPDFILTVPAFVERINKVIERNIKENKKENTIKFVKKIANGLSRVGIDFRRKVFNEVHEELGSNLKYILCGGAPIDTSLINKIEGYGFKFLQGYGLTETSPLVSCTTTDMENTTGTVGKAVENVDVRVDLSANEDENSNIGQIIVKGDNVMLGYFEDEEETKKSFKKGGWFYTGDLGYFDVRGHLVITGRQKNVIVISNSRNIYPEELESIVNQIPLVSESLVYEKKKMKNLKDIVISARVTLDKDKIAQKYKEYIPDDEELFEYVQGEIKKINRMMPSYKMIKDLEIKKDDFIRTTTMKIKRKEELERIDYSNIITQESINKKHSQKKKAKTKVVNVKAVKREDGIGNIKK